MTGGNGGLCRAIARGLSSAGAKAAVTGRSEAKNADPSIEFGPDRVFALDMRDEVAIEETISPISERLGGLDILVNNAGLTRGGDSLELTREAWEEVIGTHLTGSFLCSKHAARAMKSRRRGGKIINIGSMYTMFGAARAADYAAAKTGMLGLVRSLAIEFAPSGIQVNAILPGWYETDLTRGLLSKPVGEQIRRRTPARRWGVPDDLVGTAI